jgi:hypothetical protein
MDDRIWVILMFIIVVISSFSGYIQGVKDIQMEAIENHCAQYSPKTSEFEWIGGVK